MHRRPRLYLSFLSGNFGAGPRSPFTDIWRRLTLQYLRLGAVVAPTRVREQEDLNHGYGADGGVRAGDGAGLVGGARFVGVAWLPSADAHDRRPARFSRRECSGHVA